MPNVTTSVKGTILDGIVSVNSLFTIAVFLGLSFSSAQQTLVTKDCRAGSHITKQLVLFEVISFSFFLFSSIVAQGLKMAIVVLHGKDTGPSSRAKINGIILYGGIALSGIGSVVGSVFLILSIYNVIQIRLGVVGCDGQYSRRAFYTLVIAVPIGILFYFASVIYAIVNDIHRVEFVKMLKRWRPYPG